MQLVDGYPFWLIKNGLPFSYPELVEDIKTEVLIIGGGVSGALMAYELVNAGIECVVVDARTIGLGSTCASTSLLQYEIDSQLIELQKDLGKEAAELVYKLNGNAVERLQEIDTLVGCGKFEKRKSLHFATSKTARNTLKKECEARNKIGIEVEWVDKKMLKLEFGINAPGAILSQLAGQTDAYHFTHQLHQYSIKRGARVYDRTMMTGVKNKDKKVIAKTDRGFTITAQHIVYANGYEAVSYIDKKLVKIRTTYAVASAQMHTGTEFWKDEVLIWNTDDPYLYMRTSPDRRILVGGRDEKFSSEYKLESLIEKKTRQLTKDFKKLFPQIEFIPEFGWSGTFVATKDGLPFIGALKERPNNYFALGFGGNGITFSQIASEMIRDMIKGIPIKYGKVFSFERI
jgi:glycine/D-amino acid oxidase-like deaminating enzyme